MQSFRDLKVWRLAHRFTLVVYKATASFPREELYGVTSQLRRTATSIPANIAEGCCRRTDRDFARFIAIALGSASESEYFILLARDLGYIAESAHKELSEQVEEVKRMLSGLHNRLMRAGPDQRASERT